MKRRAATQERAVSDKVVKRDKTETDSCVDWLPAEIWVHILKQLSGLELLPVRACCSRLRELVRVYFPTTPTGKHQVLRWLCTHEEPVAVWQKWQARCDWSRLEWYENKALSWNAGRGSFEVCQWLFQQSLIRDLPLFQKEIVDDYIRLIHQAKQETYAMMEQAVRHRRLEVSSWLLPRILFYVVYDWPRTRRLWKAAMESEDKKALSWMGRLFPQHPLSVYAPGLLKMAVQCGSLQSFQWIHREVGDELMYSVMQRKIRDFFIEALRQPHLPFLNGLLHYPVAARTSMKKDDEFLEKCLRTAAATPGSLSCFLFLQQHFGLYPKLVQASEVLSTSIMRGNLHAATWLHDTYSLSLNEILFTELMVRGIVKHGTTALLQWLYDNCSSTQWSSLQPALLHKSVQRGQQAFCEWMHHSLHCITADSSRDLLQCAAQNGELSLCDWIKSTFQPVFTDIHCLKRWIVEIKTIYQQERAYQWLCDQYGFSAEELPYESSWGTHWSDAVRVQLYSCGWDGES